ncbi:MAG TPA: glycosyltransferase [Candidatus Eremiobacteraceae bacterium]|nr:glycosyltransferase [Candidatus Eremiobacteraceae bacterium]
MLIVCLCPESYHWKLIPGYAAAFRRRNIEFFCISDTLPSDISLDEVLKLCPRKPSYIFHFESALPLLPQGLENSPIPTVCFHPDTYAFTKRRIRWSYLFDHAAVFHPGYEREFAESGHPGAFLIPHAVRREFFDCPEMGREYEIGWVGNTVGPLYGRRREWLPKLATQFRTNDWDRSYSLEEVADVYRRSRIVVNVGRDDFPQDANQRVFEVMASGALLLTSLPTELSELGFQEGVHFVGYRSEGEILPLIQKFLADDAARSRISSEARAKTLCEHTYDTRVSQLLDRLESFGDQKLAPARSWRRARAQLMALDFYAAGGLIGPAISEYRKIAGRGFGETIDGGNVLARALLKRYVFSRRPH